MARNYPNLRVRALKFLNDKVAELGAEPHPVDAYLSAAMRVFGGNGELATFAKNYVQTLRKTLSLGDYGMLKDEAPKQPATGGGVFTERVEEAKGMLSQPNARVCQSACIAMATGRSDIMTIRQELEAIGEPGDPAVMGKILRKKFGDRYIFDDNACLSEIREWLRAGEFLISHGWFTPSGHVICLDGIEIDAETLGYKISVKDPWSEFDGPSWSYNKQVDRYDGYYSARLLYASIVAGQSCQDASAIYRSGKMDSMHKGAWVHRILPAKKPSPSAEAPQPVGGNQAISKDVATAIFLREPTDEQMADLNRCMQMFEINTPQRKRHFLSQCCHESGGLKYMKEIGDHAYFTENYEDREDLGNVNFGDGAKFAGVGPIQTTGRSNYARLAKVVGDPKILELGQSYTAEHWAFIASGVWWNDNKMNELCDRPDVTVEMVSRMVNCGGNPRYKINGLADRIECYKRACEVI